MRKIVLIFLMLFSSHAYSQIQNTWMTGHLLNLIYPKGGIDFSSGSADTFSVFREMGFYSINTMMNDGSGNLLFYTNGIYIANANHDTLLNSQNYNPGYASTTWWYGLNVRQSVLILPYPEDSLKYITFHCSAERFYDGTIYQLQPTHLSYSKVDMNLGQGLGGIPSNEKNITIINDTLIYGHMDATKHANGRDWWVLMHRYYSDKFYKILVTPDTIQVFDQNIGSLITDDVGGQAAFSPDGSKYALFTDHALDLYDFDRCSGDLTNHQSLNFPDSVYRTGIAFSPNNRFLYANTQLNIFQYDLWAANIDSSVQLVASWIPANMPLPTTFWNCQLAPDGRIYVGTWNGNHILHYIDLPDSMGVNCNVVQNSFYLASRNLTVPTYPNYQLERLIGSSCDTLTSLQEPESESLLVNVFPNPASSQFTITYDFPTNKDGEFMLYDAYGKEVIRKKLYGTLLRC
ncbi:MAG: hypothetical protein IPL74_01325 [Bacteroidetes bacterium]|nr:hypothetical protein [Bacteroidota bacterium]